jgi:hypothetical protein
MDLPVPILTDPERAFGHASPESPPPPGAGSWRAHGRSSDRSSGCDPRDLKEVPAVEGASGIRSGFDRAQQLRSRRIEGFQRVSSGKPDIPTVERHSVHVVDARDPYSRTISAIAAFDRLMLPF